VLPSEEDAQVATHTWELASGISWFDAGHQRPGGVWAIRFISLQFKTT